MLEYLSHPIFRQALIHYCEDAFRKRGKAFENAYIRKETERMLRQLRNNLEAKRYKKYLENKENLQKNLEEQEEQQDNVTDKEKEK